MPVNTLNLALLAIDTRIQSRQKADRFDVLLCCLIFVLERTFVHFRTRTTEIVVIAELVVSSAFFNLFEDWGGDNNLLVKASLSWIPFHFRMR